MQIEKNLPQFNDENTFLISTGRQKSKIYFAFNGKISLVDEIFIPTPTFTDREGFFAQRSSRGARGLTLRTGAVQENQKNHLETKFKNSLVEKIRELSKKYQKIQIYLYTPDYMKNIILNYMPKDLRKTVKQVFFGSYYNYHPFKLLEIIKVDQDSFLGKNDPRNKRAKKLLDKTNFK